jgi:tetratricopeptide (TPR) repeat protein
MNLDHGDCLSQEELTDYLEGGLDPAIKTVTEAHLLTCDRCRESLALFMRLLKNEMTPEEAAVVQSAAESWSATKVGSRMTKRQTGARMGWLLALAGVLIVGIVSLPFLLNRTMEPASGEEIVQLLLSQTRPFEAQLSGQPHLPILRTRGLEDPGVSYGLLDGEMTRLAADDFQMGRFYLIQKDFSRAIPFLKRAEQEVGSRAEFHNDLGAAYMEAGDDVLLPMAGQEFRHALDSDPAFAPSIFNLAIFYERTGATSEAARELRRFLQIDSTSAWSAEARSKLEGFSR